MGYCEIRFSFNFFVEFKKFLIPRIDLIFLTFKSPNFSNLRGYHCKVALKRNEIDFNLYFFGSIQNVFFLKKKFMKKNLFLLKRILIKLKNFFFLIPLDNISNQIPKKKDIVSFFSKKTIIKEINSSILTLKNFKIYCYKKKKKKKFIRKKIFTIFFSKTKILGAKK